MANNTWRLLKDERLPPTVYNFWSYDLDSYSWHPVQYDINKPVDTPLTLSHDYENYLQTEKTVIHPLITSRGGLSEVDIQALENNALQFPDIKSGTIRTKTILSTYATQLINTGIIPPNTLN